MNLSNMGGGVKSVQRGVVNATVPITLAISISPVNASKTFVLFNGSTTNNSTYFYQPQVTLTNSTTLTITTLSTVGVTGSWQVVEYF